MIKKGFTLIEALLAILILGLVATLVIPTLASNIRKQTYASALSNAVTNFENAMEANMLKAGTNELSGQAWWLALSNTLNDSVIINFKNNVTKSLALTDYSKTPLSYKTLEGGDVSNDILKIAVRFMTKNGVEYQIYINALDWPDGVPITGKTESEALANNVNYTSRAGVVFIDVNGDKLPNILGRDLFWFDVGVDGKLYPYGSRDYCFFNGTTYSNVSTECVTNKKGEYCAAHLIKNGYKMDY